MYVSDVLVVPAHIAEKLDSVTEGEGFTVAVTAVLVVETHPVIIFLASA